MLSVVTYRTWDEVQELREQWNPLLSKSLNDTVFLTWEWVSAWWNSYGANRIPFVLSAWEDGELVGVAPLYAQQMGWLGQDWTGLRLIGDGSHDSDYLDCFSQPGREAEVMTFFVRFLELQRSSWDWLELNGPRQHSASTSALLTCARERGWGARSESISCATLQLPPTWDEYLKQLEPRFRTKVRSSLSSLQQCVGSAPLECGSKEEIESWLPPFFDLHSRRWSSQGQPGVFRDAAKRSFYGELSRLALDRGWLAFHRLNWGERPLAFQHGLLYRNRFHLLQEGYDPAFSAIRPGVALRAWLMRRWIEAGVQEYDFLAGAARYKLEWGASQHLTLRLRLAAKTGSIIAALEWPDFRARTRESLGRLAPAVLLRARRQLLMARAHSQGQGTNGNGKARSQISVRRLARQVAARTYSWFPVGNLGRALADHYTWQGRGASFPLRRRTHPVCQIFLYHRVNNENDPFLGGIPSAAFAAQMEYVARHFPLLTLDQVAKGEFPQGHSYCVAVTFDDGYRDNFVTALPILKKFRVPATVFLATGSIESGQLPWYDQVRLAFKLTARRHLSLKDMGGPEGNLEALSDRLRLLDRTLGWLRRIAHLERSLAISALFQLLGVPNQLNLPNQMLRWDEIRQMSKHHVSFGAHTVSHPPLSRVSAAEMKMEIAGSKDAIEDRLQVPVLHFAYPFGQPFDFNAEVKQSVQDAGFKTAVTTVWGLNQPGDDPFELRRFSPWETDPALFRMKLDWYRFRGGNEGNYVAGAEAAGAARN
ncbi:MAG TPA: GNAT family N-acetyltransferase [Terriglobales bacterium]|nr:GNAT family N-acetyltransferase [Terriglobales bacterium]